MDGPVRDALEARLHANMSRRRFIRGVGGLTALTVLGPSALIAACNAPAGSSGNSAAAATPSAAGPSSPPASAAASAKLGGSLNFIGYDGEDARNVAKPFFEANGITVNPTFIADAFEPLTRLNTGGRGQMDIISDNKDFQRAVLAADVELFQALDMSRLPNAEGLFPAFKNAAWLTKNGKVYGIPVIWGDEPCVYNPDKWKGVPDKYTDFSDPKYKGELVFVDDPIANTWLFGKSLGYPEPNRVTQKQLDDVIQAMLKVKPNIVTLSATLGDQADVLVRGDASMAIGGWSYQVLIAAQKGVKVVSASPATDGTYFWSDAYALAVDAPNPDNAYAFIDFMMKPENNAAIAAELGSGATVEKAVDLMDATAKGLYSYDIAKKADGGVLGSQVVSPPQKADGDILGVADWKKAWEAFKLA